MNVIVAAPQTSPLPHTSMNASYIIQHSVAGNSPFNIEAMSAAVAALMQALDLPPDACLVGYSLGARVALHAAVHHTNLMSKVVLISGTAGISDEPEGVLDASEAGILDDSMSGTQNKGMVGILAAGVAIPQAGAGEGLGAPEEIGAVGERAHRVARDDAMASSLARSGRGFSKRWYASPMWSSFRQHPR